MLTINCHYCHKLLTVRAGEYSDWHKATGRPPRYYVDCREGGEGSCPMWMQTFYVANQAEYDDRDFSAYCEDRV